MGACLDCGHQQKNRIPQDSLHRVGPTAMGHRVGDVSDTDVTNGTSLRRQGARKLSFYF